MAMYILALALLLVTLLFISLQKTYYFFPVRELKRQARTGDPEASTLYRAVAYGSSLRLLLWIIIGLTLAGSFVLMQSVAPGWLVFLALAGLVWYAFAWAPNAAVSGLGARLTLILTPMITWILYYAHPMLDAIMRFVELRRSVMFHTGLFERQDLVELIERQRELSDSRITREELDLVLHALTFGDKTASSVMVHKHDVIAVKETDVIGPILMDELYERAYSRFPVLSAEDAEVIVGTLHLRDLISAAHGGTVRDVMRKPVCYVHEDQTLYQVLHAFLTTKQHIFVVINSDEEYVGIITIEDVLEQIIGHKIADDFDGYEDRRSVAEAASKNADRPDAQK